MPAAIRTAVRAAHEALQVPREDVRGGGQEGGCACGGANSVQSLNDEVG